MSLLFGHLSVKHHLIKQVAKLATQIVKIGTPDGVDHFISFFQRTGRNGGKGLLAIPRAAILRIAQGFHYAQQAIERSHCFIHSGGLSAQTD